jgi:thiamine-monophosphate kinase
MNEFQLIERLTAGLPLNASTRVGCGDDCAVLDLGLPDEWLLFKTDAAVEGVHFDEAATAESIGHKALGRCLSDVAAMGGRATHALVTIGLPTDFAVERVEGIYRGLRSLAGRHGVAIVGGETTTNPERIFLSIAVIGTVHRNRCPLRSGARVGDALLVTGELGGSLVSGRHLSFEPRLVEATWLTQHFQVHAMIDVSDGLAGDLRHLLKASGVGAELLASAIPISVAARTAARAPAQGVIEDSEIGKQQGKTPLERALTDGEDFELLFTVPAAQAVELTDAWREHFTDLELSCIGRIVDEPGLVLRQAGGIRPLNLDGYVHFQGS